MLNRNRITGILLAGGKSSRMGQDKGSIRFGNKLLIEYSIDLLKKITNKIIIVANNDLYDHLGWPVVKDVIKECGPMGGIYTGLVHTETDLNIVLSCDTPCLNKSILVELLKHADNSDITIAQSKDQVHPLCGIYKKKIKPSLKLLLDEKKFKLKDMLTNFKADRVIFNDTNCFLNINTPDDINQLITNNYL